MEQDDDPATAETQSPALVSRPVIDPRSRDVARTKIANALFETNQHVTLGRYHLLDRIGQGGMGVVWGAFDPELERRVAIKLVRAKALAARERILLEGQALAKLSHPNVVAVYDVGVVEDEVYLVMEWIRGKNLRMHCAEPRSVAEIVALYRAAGEGLLAAHRADLIHRDFKPENVMVGDDGRVRVVDFGLALDREDGDDGGVAGTPKYMAPEQQHGSATEAADQYAFGIALREALVGRNGDGRDAPVPGWLAAIVARASAAQPSQRFSSFDELLRALARDPARIWRRRVIGAAALVAIGGAFAIGTMRATDAPAPCAGGREELARMWGPEARARLVAHAKTLGPYALAETQRLDSVLASYGDRYVDIRRRECLAHRRGEVTTRLYERGLACMSRARAAFTAVVEVLGRTSVASYPNAVLAARALPDVEHCMTAASDSAVPPPDRTIAGVVDTLGADATRARYLALAGDPQALAVAKPIAAAADRINYQPLVARAQLALGAALTADDDRLVDAVAAYAKAATAALAAFDDELLVEAYARELFVASRMSAEELPPIARDFAASVPFVETIATRAGPAPSFARTLFYNNVGTYRLGAGDPQGARQWFRRARDELRAGASGVELYVALGNLAMVVESPTERAQLFAEERSGLERALGSMHAFTLFTRMRAAGYIEHPVQAAQALNELCAAFETWYPHQRDRIAKCNYERAWLADERGDRETARVAYEAVERTEFGQEAQVAHAQLALLADRREDAERAAREIIATTTDKGAWFTRFPAAVDAWIVVANVRLALGDTNAASTALREALAIMADPRMNKTAVRYLRRLARVRTMLATQLAARDPKLAAELAASALTWSRSAGGYDERVRELASLTGSH
jgi:eukaryotic-like serine/threonine-protein kinase